MKNYVYRYFPFIIGMSIATVISGQNNTTRLDSVPVMKPKMNQDLYLFSGSGGTENQFWKNQPTIFKGKKHLRDFGNGLLTLASGVGFGSSNDIIWRVDGRIKCNDALPDWNINLFCEGNITKDKERVRDADGSWSVETNKIKMFFWDKDAPGFILEGADTVGFFLVIMDPLRNTLLKPWGSSRFLMLHLVI